MPSITTTLRFFFPVLTFFLLLSCNKKLVATKVYSQFPFAPNDTTIIDYQSTFSIMSYRDVMLYSFPVTDLFITNNTLDSTKEQLQYFIYKGKKGILLDSLNAEVIHFVDVDSIINSKAFGNVNYDSLSLDLNILSDRPSSKYTREQIAVLATSRGPDSIYLSYNKKLRSANFTISKRLDSLNNSKLSEIKLYWKKGTVQEQNDTWVILGLESYKIKEKPILKKLYKKWNSANMR